MNDKTKRPEVADTTPAHADATQTILDEVLAVVANPSNYTLHDTTGKVNQEVLDTIAYMALIRTMASSYVATMQRMIGEAMDLGTEITTECGAILAVRERAGRELIAAARLHKAADEDPDLWTWLHTHEYLQTRKERAGIESRTNIGIDLYDVRGGDHNE